MGRPARVALLAAVAIGGLVVLIGAALLLWVDPRLYPSRLEALAARALGMELCAAGRTDIGVFPAPSLTLADASLHRRCKQIATVQQVTIGVDRRSLFGEDLHIDFLVLAQPVITLERDRAGRINVSDTTPAATSSPAQS